MIKYIVHYNLKKEKAMSSGIKKRITAIKFYLIIFIGGFIGALYMYKPMEEPTFTTNEKGEMACSVCDKDIENTSIESDSHVSLSEKKAYFEDKDQLKISDMHTSPYGSVLSIDDGQIKGALVEHVEVYPKEHANTENTITRKGMLVRYPRAKATILVCHGFMCDRFDVGLLRLIFPQDYNIMTFDFRAHGECREGQFCTFGHDESQDVIAAARFLKNHPGAKDKPLFVYGFSMGAAASIEAQSQAQLFDAMVLDCPFDSTENVIKRGLNNMKINLLGYEFSIPGRSYLEQYAFHPYVQALVKTVLKTIAKFDPQDIQISLHPCSPVESVKKIDIPCFFIHCRNDEKVPVEAVKDVFAGANGPKKLWITNGRRHFDSYFYNPEEYAYQVKNFLKLAVEGPDSVATAIDDAIVVEDRDMSAYATLPIQGEEI
jgi:pimeloyl-ACP methyl ester carboxylesterase